MPDALVSIRKNRSSTGASGVSKPSFAPYLEFLGWMLYQKGEELLDIYRNGFVVRHAACGVALFADLKHSHEYYSILG